MYMNVYIFFDAQITPTKSVPIAPEYPNGSEAISTTLCSCELAFFHGPGKKLELKKTQDCFLRLIPQVLCMGTFAMWLCVNVDRKNTTYIL